MKQLKCIIAMIMAALLLIGCTDILFTTSEYRSYKSFVDNHKAGMEKEDILDELGSTDGYRDVLRNYHAIARADHERFEENLAEGTSVAWAYECSKQPSPPQYLRQK